ncbi:MAG TPA: hypothetical protein PL033_19970 [Candidatus Brocadiia bacterium]|nr:hypothetical protein [Candidatus Brocadiia bacterium]
MSGETTLAAPPQGMSEKTRLALLVLLGFLSLAATAGLGYMAGVRKAHELGQQELEAIMSKESLAAVGLEKFRTGSMEAAEERCAELKRLTSDTEMKWGELSRTARMAESSLKGCQLFSFVSQRKTLQESLSDTERIRRLQGDLVACEQGMRTFKDALPPDDERNLRSVELCLESLLCLKDLAAAAVRYNEAYQRILESGCAGEAMTISSSRDASVDELRRAALLLTLAGDVDKKHEPAIEEMRKQLTPPDGRQPPAKAKQ